MTQNDSELLKNYVQMRSEEAFAELVRRHIGLVYSAALRQMNGVSHLADDITQIVFNSLAKKAPELTRHTSIVGSANGLFPSKSKLFFPLPPLSTCCRLVPIIGLADRSSCYVFNPSTC